MENAVKCSGGDGIRACQCSGNVHECKCTFRKDSARCSWCTSLRREPFRELLITRY